MDYKAFIKFIKAGSLENFYLFKGEEKYLIDNTLDMVKATIPEEYQDFNLYIPDVDEFSLDTMKDFINRAPLFYDRKLLIIKDLKTAKDSSKLDLYAIILDMIPNLKDTSLIAVDRENSLDQRFKLVKYARKEGLLVEFPRADKRDFERWVLKKIKDNGKDISQENLKLLTETTGYNEYRSTVDLYQVDNELMKVLNYDQAKEISKEGITRTMTGYVDDNIFRLLEEIFSDNKRAIVSFRQMKEGKDSIFKIWHMILRWGRLLFEIKAMEESFLSYDEIRKKLSLSPYEYKRLANISSRRNSDEWRAIFKKLEKIDYLSKSASINLEGEIEAFIGGIGD